MSPLLFLTILSVRLPGRTMCARGTYLGMAVIRRVLFAQLRRPGQRDEVSMVNIDRPSMVFGTTESAQAVHVRQNQLSMVDIPGAGHVRIVWLNVLNDIGIDALAFVVRRRVRRVHGLIEAGILAGIPAHVHFPAVWVVFFIVYRLFRLIEGVFVG